MASNIKKGDPKLREKLHDLRSSLQALLLKSEFLLEGANLQEKHYRLLSGMLADIEQANLVVGTIERDFGGVT